MRLKFITSKLTSKLCVVNVGALLLRLPHWSERLDGSQDGLWRKKIIIKFKHTGLKKSRLSINTSKL